MKQLKLEVQTATPENTVAYGDFIGIPPQAELRGTAFYEGAVKLWSPPEFVSDDETCFTIARVSPRDNEVIWMERHFKHTQAFIPLGGKPFMVVLGEPNDSNTPDLDNVGAYYFDGSCGFMMKIGTWHEFPFAVVPDTDLIVILREETMRDLEVKENDEAIGGDLEKRHLPTRLGVSISFSPPAVTA